MYKVWLPIYLGILDARYDDYREVTEGHGHDPLNGLIVGYQNCDSVYFEVPNGDIAGIAGVHKGGQIWMLCTPAIYDYPHTFAREAKRYVNARTRKVTVEYC